MSIFAVAAAEVLAATFGLEVRHEASVMWEQRGKVVQWRNYGKGKKSKPLSNLTKPTSHKGKILH